MIIEFIRFRGYADAFWYRGRLYGYPFQICEAQVTAMLGDQGESFSVTLGESGDIHLVSDGFKWYARGNGRQVQLSESACRVLAHLERDEIWVRLNS